MKCKATVRSIMKAGPCFVEKTQMDDYWKYVVINENDMIIFPPTMSHSQFKNMGNITSAGLIRIYGGEGSGAGIRCFGESTTLSIRSKPQHDELVARGLFVEN